MPRNRLVVTLMVGVCAPAAPIWGHGSAVSPSSRVYNVYNANPENPSFPLAANAINLDSKSAYYTWNQVSRNIPQAVQQGLPAGFDYSPWVPSGQLASGGRVDTETFGDLTYQGLDQVSADWPTTPAVAGQDLAIDFYATAVHEPSVWDVWMTTPDWTPELALNWDQMEFLDRPSPVLSGNHYRFDVAIPSDRSGRHVLWIAWQRNDAVGEVFFSTSDLLITAPQQLAADFNGNGVVDSADYAVWRNHLGATGLAAWSPGDGNGDGNVDADDLPLWRAAYGTTLAGANAAAGAAPEPAAAALVAAGLALAFGRSNRRGRHAN